MTTCPRCGTVTDAMGCRACLARRLEEARSAPKRRKARTPRAIPPAPSSERLRRCCQCKAYKPRSDFLNLNGKSWPWCRACRVVWRDKKADTE